MSNLLCLCQGHRRCHGSRMRWCLFAFIADYIKPRQSIIALSLPFDHKRKSFLTKIWAILLKRSDFYSLFHYVYMGFWTQTRLLCVFFHCIFCLLQFWGVRQKDVSSAREYFWSDVTEVFLIPAFKSNADQNWKNSLTIERLLPNTLEKVTRSQPLWTNAMERNRVKQVL